MPQSLPPRPPRVPTPQKEATATRYTPHARPAGFLPIDVPPRASAKAVSNYFPAPTKGISKAPDYDFPTHFDLTEKVATAPTPAPAPHSRHDTPQQAPATSHRTVPTQLAHATGHPPPPAHSSRQQATYPAAYAPSSTTGAGQNFFTSSSSNIMRTFVYGFLAGLFFAALVSAIVLGSKSPFNDRTQETATKAIDISKIDFNRSFYGASVPVQVLTASGDNVSPAVNGNNQ